MGERRAAPLPVVHEGAHCRAELTRACGAGGCGSALGDWLCPRCTGHLVLSEGQPWAPHTPPIAPALPSPGGQIPVHFSCRCEHMLKSHPIFEEATPESDIKLSEMKE